MPIGFVLSSTKKRTTLQCYSLVALFYIYRSFNSFNFYCKSSFLNIKINFVKAAKSLGQTDSESQSLSNCRTFKEVGMVKSGETAVVVEKAIKTCQFRYAIMEKKKTVLA